MKRYLPASSILAAGVLGVMSLMALPAAAQGDRGPAAAAAAAAGDRGGSVGAGGRAVGGGGSGSSGGGGSSTASSGGSSSGGGGSSSTGSGGSDTGRARAVDRGAGGQGVTGGGGYAVPRERGDGTRGIVRNGGADRSSDGAPGGIPAYARPRDGREPVGTAAPRGSVPSTGAVPIVVRGGYYGGYFDPWWYGPGYIGSYGGYYDPWYGGYPSYPQPPSSPYLEEGKLRLKIKPRQAEVYVDGYYAGIVDNFDGLFQRLHLETGAHHISIRAPGYEPLEIDVRIALEQTTTYEGELKKIP